MGLDRGRCDEDEGVRTVGLCQREIGHPVRLTRVERRGDMAGGRVRRLRLQQHVDAHVLDCLEAADGTAELVADPGVVGGHLHGVHGTAGLLGDQCHCRIVECGLQCRLTRPRPADQPCGGSGQCQLTKFAGLVDRGQRCDRESRSRALNGENLCAGGMLGCDIEPFGS